MIDEFAYDPLMLDRIDEMAIQMAAVGDLVKRCITSRRDDSRAVGQRRDAILAPVNHQQRAGQVGGILLAQTPR